MAPPDGGLFIANLFLTVRCQPEAGWTEAGFVAILDTETGHEKKDFGLFAAFHAGHRDCFTWNAQYI